MIKLTRHGLMSAALALLLAGCSGGDFFGSDEPPPLEGERISILELQKNLEPDSPELNVQGFIAPTAWRNEFWPQAGGYPNHAMQHLVLSDQPLKEIWKTGIGRGTTKALPITAQPIIVDGMVFTLDTDASLSAFSAENGKRIWKTDVQNPNEDDPVISGGLAYSRGRLFVTNGFNELLNVDPRSGKIIWRAAIPAPSRAAPTVMDERVFVTTLDNRLIAMNASDGSILWEYSGIAEVAGLVGAASPAASRDVVIPVFSSGEIFALRLENGSTAWSDNLSSFNTMSGVSAISDIRGLPIVDKGLVIAISFGGRMVAIDERTGTRIWQREIGGSETPWVAGNHLFVISTDNELVALGRDNGVIRWVTQLPRYENEDSRSGAMQWTGPVLAGGRLIVASSTGVVAEVEPEQGNMIRQWKSGASSIRMAPVVAAGTLYILPEDGTLRAYK